MSDSPPEFDLKFLPDWLKEGASTPKYADYEGEREDRRGGRDDRGGRRDGPGGRRPGGGPGERRGPGGPGGAGRGPGGPGRDRPRGDRPGGGRTGPGAPGGPARRPDDRRGPGGPGGAGERRRDEGDRRRTEEPREPREPRVPQPPVQVKIEFLPEPNGAQGIARQIKGSNRAYPLFGAGRLFLEKPERHRVRISSLDPTVVLYQIGDGPIALSQAALERTAFRTMKDQYYKEEVVQGEPIKGNYTNVARSRSSGIFLGPTNYHSYQPSLRRLYEERFSRRMSFPDFLHQDVEILTDEQSIADWKEQARSTTTIATTQEPEAIVFKTAAEAEAHFRAHYLRQLVKAGLSLECSGQASRVLPDRQLSMELRDAWERERGFPVQTVNNLRPYLMEAGLHFFKHRKRILYVSAVRPMRHAAGQALSTGVAAILQVIETTPKCNRRTLAKKIIGAQNEAPEGAEQRESLARDLHYLIYSGQVIEFADGTLDLPLAPAPPRPGGKSDGKPAAEADEPELSEQDLVEAAAAEGLSPQGGESPVANELPAAESLSAPGEHTPVETIGEFSAQQEGQESASSVHESPPQPGVTEAAAVTAFSALEGTPEAASVPADVPEVPEPSQEHGWQAQDSLRSEHPSPEAHAPAGDLHASEHSAGESVIPSAESLQGDESAEAPLAPVVTQPVAPEEEKT